MDIDFYNPTDSTITVDIKNLAYGVDYNVINYYYTGGIETTLEIEAKQHKLLFNSLNAPLLCTNPNGTAWARTPVILFDFVVNSGNVVLSSVAAYDKNNLKLKQNQKNVLNNGEMVDAGEIIYYADENGKTVWNQEENDPRPNESDLYAKYKGIAKNQSAWINANLRFVIGQNQSMEVYMKDDYYDAISNPKSMWMTHINPINDAYDALLYSLPGAGHDFIYHREEGGIWNFKFDYRDLRDIYVDAKGQETINNPVPENVIIDLKQNVAAGKNTFEGAPDELSASLGEWGATYHYYITIINPMEESKKVSYAIKNFNNITMGYKKSGEESYTVLFKEEADKEEADKVEMWWEPFYIEVAGKSSVTFEVVLNAAAGHGGTNNTLFVSSVDN